MLKKQAQVLLTFLFFADLVVVGLSWNFAYMVRFFWFNYEFSILGVNIPFVEKESIPGFMEYFKATFVIVFFSIFCFIYAKMYNPKRISRYKAEFRSILKSNVFLFIILTGLTFYYRRFSYSRIQSVYFLFFSIVFITFFRFSVRVFLSYLRKKGKNLKRILIIGQGSTAQSFIQKILDNRSLGFLIVGYVFNEETMPLDSISYLGTFSKLPDIIGEKKVDQVYVCLDSNQQSHLEKINHYLAEQMVDLHIVPDIYHTLNINPEILDLDGMPIIALRQSSVEGWNRILKRTFDIVGSMFIICLLTPFWIILPIFIKLTSNGPVFYLQERMGLDGRPFRMIKFRSMKINAEAETGAVWAKKNDDRRTLVGKIIRKTSLDEIPQFFNVLHGSMSLVGPRPERPVFIEEFKKQIPNYMLRHKMKAGITGWAQVNGWRGNTSLKKRIEYDIYYLTHWSIWFDIKIIIKTIFTGMIDPNAY